MKLTDALFIGGIFIGIPALIMAVDGSNIISALTLIGGTCLAYQCMSVRIDRGR